MAEELYEAFRRSKQSDIGNNMEQVPKLLERGLEEQAKQIGTKVAAGVRELRERIEEASEKVVGSEQASLRLALSELESAKQQIEGEANRNDPSSQRQDASSSTSSSSSSSATNPQKDVQNSSESQDNAGRTGPPEQNSPQQSSPEGDSQPQNSQAQDSQQQNNSRQPGSSQQQSNAQGGPARGGSQTSRSGMRAGNEQSGNDRGEGGVEQFSGSNTEGASPLTGKDFAEWSDTLRDVEELVSDPEMKAEVARIREAAREMRIDFSKHAKDPQWPLVRRLIVKPLDQVRERVQDSLLRSSAERNAIVPVDRDPLPSIYQQQLDLYYENLGSGQRK